MDVQKLIKGTIQQAPSGLLDNIHGAYAAVGLKNPLMRGSITGLGVWGLLHWLKPGFWYREGEARPWSPTSEDPDAVLLSVEIVALIAGVLAAGV